MAANEKIVQWQFTGENAQLKKTIADLKKDMEGLQGALNKKVQAGGLESLERQIKEGLKPLQDLKKGYEDLAREVANASRVNQGDIVNQRSIDKATVGLRVVKEEMREATQEARGFQETFRGVAGTIQSVVLPLAGISAAISLFLGKASADFAGFEKTLNTIKAVSDATQGEIAAIQASSIDLGQKSIFSNQQVADSYQELAKAGFDAQESLESMPALLDLAAAAGGDLALAGSLIGSSLKAFRVETSETGRFVDVLAQAANKSAADIADMGLAFKQVAPIAASTGQSLEDMSALLAVLANNAIKGGDAGSDLRNTITRLVNPSKEAAGVLKQLGVSITDADGNIRPLVELFKDFGVTLNTLTPAAKAQAASILAGQENLKTFLILAESAPETLDEMVASMNNAEGAAKKMADTINSGLSNAFEQFSGTVETIMVMVGEGLAPALQSTLLLATDFLNVVGQNKQLVQFAAGAAAATAAILGLAAAMSGAITVAAPLVLAVLALGAPLSAVGVGIGVIVAAILGAGGLTVALASMAERTDFATRSIEDLEAELDSSSAKILAQSRDVETLGEEYDRLKQKTTLAEAEKRRMSEILDILAKKFPGQIDMIRRLALEYGSLEKAARAARVQMLAVERGKEIDAQLERVQQEARNLQNEKTLAGIMPRFVNPNGTAGYDDQIKNLEKQRKALVNSRQNLSKDTAEIHKQEEALANVTSKETGGVGGELKGIGERAKKSASTLQNAQEQFRQLVEKIEVDLTGFHEGEFEKRRAAAQASYDDQLVRIRDLSAKGKIAQADVTSARIKALDLHRATLERIKSDEEHFLAERQNAIRAQILLVQELDAQLSSNNPLDDIQSSLERTNAYIETEFQASVRKLKEQFNFDTNSEEMQKAIETAQQVAERRRLIAKRRAELETVDALNAQNHLSAEILKVKAELSGNELEIAKRTNDLIIADLTGKLEKAKAEFGANSDVARLAQAELDKALLQGQKNYIQKEVELQNNLVAKAQQQVQMYGERNGLMIELQGHLQKQLELLEKQAAVQGLTETETAAIRAHIVETVKALAQAEGKTSKFGRALGALSGISLPSSKWNSFFQGAVGGVQQIYDQFLLFDNDPNNANRGFSSFLKQNGASVAAFAGQTLTTLSGTVKKGSRVIGALGGALSGAAAGMAFGPIGAAVGALAGAALGAFSGGSSRQQKRMEEAQRNEEKNQQWLSAFLREVNQNDLNSLNEAQQAIAQRWRAQQRAGKTGKAPLKRALTDIQVAIKERRKAITEAIKELDYQNSIFEKELRAVNTDDQLQSARVQREIDLSDLDRQTKGALDQFKDSTEAQQLILRNAELQRQLILSTSSREIINMVIAEQNAIRAMRAQTLVDQARVSGNTIDIINAELQTRLVSIDNEVAAFQGAEEAKTEFLKQKAAERERIIKEANDSVQQVLDQGLAILNEGLVVGETKAEGQQKRLRELFGSLNPMGLIRADGNLVNSNITIGSGAIQFILEGIENAQDLIAQLDDPVIQAKLLAVLNQAIVRA